MVFEQIAMISFSSLPGTKSAADCNPKEISMARETYEYACLLSVALCAALPAEERGSDDQGQSSTSLSISNLNQQPSSSISC
jgi:hypothetical protein